jgi:hypothetical protein
MAAIPPRLRSVLSMEETDLRSIAQELDALAMTSVLVGFPDETADRDPDEETGAKTPVTNAALGYIHDNGAPEQNIPARPFMLPGIAEAQDRLTNQLGKGLDLVLKGLPADMVMHRVGLIAQAALRTKINEGIPPPLSEVTLRDRARRGREGAMWELAWRQAGAPPGLELAKPLVDTGQLRNAITYVIRGK